MWAMSPGRNDERPAPEGAGRSGGAGRSEAGTSDGAHVLRLRALLALRHVEVDALVVVEALVAVAGDAGEVDEDVGAAVVGSDEAEALFAVEPLHSALGH